MKRLVLAVAVFVAAAVGGYAVSAHATNCYSTCNTNPYTGSQWCSTSCP